MRIATSLLSVLLASLSCLGQLQYHSSKKYGISLNNQKASILEVQTSSRVKSNQFNFSSLNSQEKFKPLHKRWGFWVSSVSSIGVGIYGYQSLQNGRVVLGRNFIGLSTVYLSTYLTNYLIQYRKSRSDIREDRQLRNAERKLYAEGASENVKPARLVIQNLKFIDSSNDLVLDALEEAKVTFELSNKGTGSAKSIKMYPRLEKGKGITMFFEKDLGKVKPGETIQVEVRLVADLDVADVKQEKLTLEFLEINGFEPPDQPVNFETRAYQKPDLKILDMAVDNEQGTGQVLTNNEMALTLQIGNVGLNKAEDVVVKFTKGKNVYFDDENMSYQALGVIERGEAKNVKIKFWTNSRVENAIPLFVDIEEKYGKFKYEQHRVNLKLDQNIKSSDAIVVKGKQLKLGDINIESDLSVDVERDIPKNKERSEKSLGIIIGIENYQNVQSDVTFAMRDAAFMKEYFTSVLGIPENRLYIRKDNEATKAEFEKIFSQNGWLDGRSDTATNVFIYYVGHGAPSLQNKKAYLIPFDGDPNYPEITGYSLESLYSNLENIESKTTTLFMDACFTGESRNSERLLADSRGIGIVQKAPVPKKNLNVLSASQGDQVASAWQEKKHGLFTYYLMKGLKGDADSNQDGIILTREICSYLSDKVENEAGFLDRKQKPQCQLKMPEFRLVEFR